MYKIQEATTEHLPEILALWTKLMNIHKEMDGGNKKMVDFKCHSQH